MAGRDGTSGDKEGVDFKWVKAENGNYKTKKYFTKAEKEAMKSSAPKESARPRPRTSTSGSGGTKKKDIATMASEAIDRSGPTRPRARPGSDEKPTRPRSRPAGKVPTATSVTTPEVTTTTLPKAGGATYKGYTWEEYRKGNNLGRLRQGLPMGLSKSEFEARAQEEANAPAPTPKPKTGNIRGGGSRGNQAAIRRAKGGLVGYAKGGMVKANCGASMKPTQKSTRKK